LIRNHQERSEEVKKRTSRQAKKNPSKEDKPEAAYDPERVRDGRNQSLFEIGKRSQLHMVGKKSEEARGPSLKSQPKGID